jgi:3-oxoacyl-[acyl-carrier-protein] synthase-3
MNIGIIGTGSALPEKILTNDDLSKIVDTSDEWITTRTGIKERRIAAKEDSIVQLATAAASAAIADAGIKIADIDLIILSTATPEYYFLQLLHWYRKI